MEASTNVDPSWNLIKHCFVNLNFFRMLRRISTSLSLAMPAILASQASKLHKRLLDMQLIPIRVRGGSKNSIIAITNDMLEAVGNLTPQRSVQVEVEVQTWCTYLYRCTSLCTDRCAQCQSGLAHCREGYRDEAMEKNVAF